eukprot:gene3388-5933_t
MKIEEVVERLISKGEAPTEFEIFTICNKAKEVFATESNVHCIKSPVTLAGDVHGQFYDVLELFRIGGFPPFTNYLFLGDYVDRGAFSVETITLLLCFKVLYPDRFTMLRGNHESRAISQDYGFYKECVQKYGTNSKVWKYFTDAFDFITISALIDGKIFCVHGGISPQVMDLDQIRVIDRFLELPGEGSFSDLVWSDPDVNIEGFGHNPRGAGYMYGSTALKLFLNYNNLQHLCRAHQLCMEGYQILFENRMSTVWSAPNYCGKGGNLASILEIDENLQSKFNIFTEAPPQDRKDLQLPPPDYFL